MTIVDVFMLLPIWTKIIIYIVSIYIVIELLLMPYHANMMDARCKSIEKTLKEILEATKSNTKGYEDIQKIVSFLLSDLGERRKKTDKEK